MATRVGTAQWDAVSSGDAGKRDPGTRVFYREDFTGGLPRPSSALLPTAANSLAVNPNLVISGYSVVGGTAAVFDSNGGIALVAKSASSRRVFIKTAGKSNRSVWNNIKLSSSDSPCFSTLVKTGAAITTVQYFAGLCLTYARDVLTGTPTITDDDQVLFGFDSAKNATKLYVISSIAGTDTLTDTGVNLTVDTSYLLQISIDSSRRARCYVNGTLVYTTGQLTASITLKPRVEIINRTTAATRKLMCRYLEVSKNAN